MKSPTTSTAKGKPRGCSGGRKTLDSDGRPRATVGLTLPADVAEAIPPRSEMRARAVNALINEVRRDALQE